MSWFFYSSCFWTWCVHNVDRNVVHINFNRSIDRIVMSINHGLIKSVIHKGENIIKLKVTIGVRTIWFYVVKHINKRVILKVMNKERRRQEVRKFSPKNTKYFW